MKELEGLDGLEELEELEELDGLDGLGGLELSMEVAPTAHVKLLIQPLLTFCSPSAPPLLTHTVLRTSKGAMTHPPASRRAPPSRRALPLRRGIV